jgi:hypothetical protein
MREDGIAGKSESRAPDGDLRPDPRARLEVKQTASRSIERAP